MCCWLLLASLEVIFPESPSDLSKTRKVERVYMPRKKVRAEKEATLLCLQIPNTLPKDKNFCSWWSNGAQMRDLPVECIGCVVDPYLPLLNYHISILPSIFHLTWQSQLVLASPECSSPYCKWLLALGVDFISRKITENSWEEYFIVNWWLLCPAVMNSADKSAQALAQEEVLAPVHTYILKLKCASSLKGFWGSEKKYLSHWHDLNVSHSLFQDKQLWLFWENFCTISRQKI